MDAKNLEILDLLVKEIDRTPQEQTLYPSEFSQLCEDWVIDNAKELQELLGKQKC